MMIHSDISYIIDDSSFNCICILIFLFYIVHSLIMIDNNDRNDAKMPFYLHEVTYWLLKFRNSEMEFVWIKE